MYLLDTDVFSQLYKRKRHPVFTRWLRDKPENLLYISTITIGEIERGADRQRHRNPVYAAALHDWLEQSIASYLSRILPVTIAIGRRWGQLSSRIGHSGADLLIAATALEHGLIVATGNFRHFVPTGAPIENPFE